MDILIICKVDAIRQAPSRPIAIVKNTIQSVSLSKTLLDIYMDLRTRNETLENFETVSEVTVSDNSTEATVSGADLAKLTVADMKGLNADFSNFLFLVGEAEKERTNSTVDQSTSNMSQDAVEEDLPRTGNTQQAGWGNVFDIMTEASKKLGNSKDIVKVPEASVKFHGGSGGRDSRHRFAAEVISFATNAGVRVYRRSLAKASNILRELCNLIWKIDGHLDKIESRKNLPVAARCFRQFIGSTLDECKFRNWNMQKKGAPKLSVEDVSKGVSNVRNCLDISLSTSYLPKEDLRRNRAEKFFHSIQVLANGIDVYLDHAKGTATDASGRYKKTLSEPFHHLHKAQRNIELETITSGTIEAFQGSRCQFHNVLAPLIEELSTSAMYSPIVVDFDRHATTDSSLWSLEKRGITAKKYTMAATVRHARPKMRGNIRSHGLPFPVGFFQEIVPGPVPIVFALWRVPTAHETRSDSRQTSATQYSSSHVRRLLSRHQTHMYSMCIVEIGKSKGTLKISSATALLQAFGFSNQKRGEADDCRIAKALSAILSSSCTTTDQHDRSAIDLAEDLRNYRCPKQGPLLSAFFAAGSDFLNHAILSTGAQVDQRRAATSEGARMYMPIAMSLPDLMHRIQHHAESVMVSVDDKCGVKIGEPGMPISALQRRRSSSICISSTNEVSLTQNGILAADLDYTIMTLTPSVTQFIEIPQERTGSFMRGASYLTLKNAVFEASTPLRHASELANSLRHRYQDATVPPVLVVFSDGGTDHRTNLYSVQLSFLWLMVELDIDEVVCVRTAPGDSWFNPAERRMAELNIAWEAASFARRAATESDEVPKDHARWFESTIKSANSLNSVLLFVADYGYMFPALGSLLV